MISNITAIFIVITLSFIHLNLEGIYYLPKTEITLGTFLTSIIILTVLIPFGVRQSEVILKWYIIYLKNSIFLTLLCYYNITIYYNTRRCRQNLPSSDLPRYRTYLSKSWLEMYSWEKNYQHDNNIMLCISG